MTGRRMLHAHKMLQRYAGEQVPARMFAAKPDGTGRDVMPLPPDVMPSPNLMKVALTFPVYYWAMDALIKASAWTVEDGMTKEKIKDIFDRIIKSHGAVHFFDTPQIVDNAELGPVPVIGMIRYGQELFALLYVEQGFDWDRLDHSYFAYNIYFVNGSTFAEFYQTMLFMWEGWASMPVEASVKPVEAPRKGVDQKTLKSYRRNPLRVVTLRKVVQPTSDTIINAKRTSLEESLTRAGASHVIGVQFDVRGHTRNQWYPAEGVHRVIWVEGYTKCKDKPRVDRATVHKVISRSEGMTAGG